MTKSSMNLFSSIIHLCTLGTACCSNVLCSKDHNSCLLQQIIPQVYRLVTYHVTNLNLQVTTWRFRKPDGKLEFSNQKRTRGGLLTYLEHEINSPKLYMQNFRSLTFLLCWEVLWFGQGVFLFWEFSCCVLCSLFSSL